jgi:4-hydroxy-3-methylbut-2-en-1-yl diphosphate reductase
MSYIYYLKPSSFCFGVKRAIEELQKVVEKHPNDSIYCIHALVHNPKVTTYFIDRGVKFVETIQEVPSKDAVVVFSAHGISRNIFNEANTLFKAVYSLECPFVSKIYNEIRYFIEKWVKQFVYIGKQGHQEAENVIHDIQFQWAEVCSILDVSEISRIPFSWPFAILSQTTLNFDLVQNLIKQIQQQFPAAITPKISDICKATYERQWVIQKFTSNFDTLVVIWGKESSNTKELYKIWEKLWKKVFFWWMIIRFINWY